MWVRDDPNIGLMSLCAVWGRASEVEAWCPPYTSSLCLYIAHTEVIK